MNGLLAYALGFATPLLVSAVVCKRPRITVDEAGHWSFPIDTLAQMLAIPPERRERFLAELPQMFRHMWAILDKYPARPLTGNAWIDDGLGELRPHVINEPKNAGVAFATRKLGGEGA